MTIAGFQKVFNFRNEKTIKLMVKLMLWAIPLYITLSITNSFYIESKLIGKGYSFCHWYTSPSFRGPDVWLKNDELCLQDGSVIISDIADWFERKNQQGIEPSVDELKEFIKETRKSRDDYTNYSSEKSPLKSNKLTSVELFHGSLLCNRGAVLIVV
ncbi:hypothetical protein P4S63_10760 [Pseudoalteromonas sp. B193]